MLLILLCHKTLVRLDNLCVPWRFSLVEAGCGSRIQMEGGQARFAAYVESITMALGHADRAAPFRSYCTGLLLPGDRKSVEPMAARIEPGRVRAAHQSLHHFVAKADWSDDDVLSAVRAHVLPAIEQQGSIRAWIIDDTGVPQKGTHSIGVARQYCGHSENRITARSP